MKVLVLTQYYWPESFRINEVVESLQKAGCDVCVLTGQPNYPDGRIYPGYRAWGCGRNDHVAGYPIYRVPIIPRGSGSGWRLALNYLSFVVSGTLAGRWLLRGQRFDVILVYGMSPILQAIPGVLLKRSTGAAVVTWVQDLWPESIEVAGFVTSPRLLSWLGAIVRWIYRHCDLLLVQSQAFVSVVSQMAGSVPVRYHPNPGELSIGGTPSEVGPRVTLEPGFNVVFAGNLGTVQALGTVLDAAERLAAHGDIHIVLVGSGSRRGWLMQESASRQLHNVQFVDRLPPEAMAPILSQASALLVTLVRSPIMSRTIPSKIQAYLAAGRPVIACLDGEGARVIEEAGAGLTCAAEDAAGLADAILRMRAMPPAELQRMAEAGHCYYRQNFDPGALAQRLVGHFRELSQGGR
ncbi:MAG: glycosyltransferase family 4 protein [Steroidobacteraceae bacterium]